MNRFITILLLLIALPLAACGGNANTETEAVAITIDMEAMDTLAFSPADLTVPTGAEVTVTLKNAGGLEHNFILTSGNSDPLTVSDADALGGVKSGNLAGGDTVTFTFIAPEPGNYQYVCTIPGHAAGGMVGTMVITP